MFSPKSTFEVSALNEIGRRVIIGVPDDVQGERAGVGGDGTLSLAEQGISQFVFDIPNVWW